MSDLTRRIADNLDRVRHRIAESAVKSGRTPEQIMLVAVTKYVGDFRSRAVFEAGCDVLGESRPQHLYPKAEALADLPVRWHMIGHLQRNKVRRVLPLVEMIHSADSPRLIETIDRVAGELSLRVPILLEVNISDETAKHGFQPDAVGIFLEELARFEHVEVRGLMCMAGLARGPDAARADFAALGELRDHLRTICPQNISLDELSMGMSGDYETAIEEGATIVRVGSALFEGVL